MITPTLDGQQQLAVDALIAVGHSRDTAVQLVLSGGGDRPTIEDAVERLLARSTENTRRTYATHLYRLVTGTAPICDQPCEPCCTPTRTRLTGPDGKPAGRRNVFECRCDCHGCRTSAIGIPALGERPVGPSVLNSDTVHVVATVALRVARKNGIYENARRVQRGKPIKPADGFGAQESAISAMRSLCAANSKYLDGYLGHDVDKPSRSQRSRRALLDFELLELSQVAESGGDDPELDMLLIEFGLCTGARREGAINMNIGRMDRRAQVIHLNEKNERTEVVPVSSDLIDRLLHHAITRGGERCNPASEAFNPNSAVFWMKARRRGQRFTPLSDRRFDTLFGRLQESMEWAAAERLGFHHLRHTMSQIIKARYGQHVAQRYLRHADREVTDRYGRCDDAELARSLSALFGFTHPLVDGIADRRTEVLRRLGYAVDGHPDGSAGVR